MVWRQSPGAHPRLRGEHSHPPRPMPGYVGSSPLTRGARPAISTFPRSVRLIPAYAGSTRCATCMISCMRAHPRLRGEHFFFGVAVKADYGSSPLTRGARVGQDCTSLACWLIPAYAGSTAYWRHTGGPTRAHPRLRGEHELRRLEVDLFQGSSPLTRGAQRAR